ncbi:adenylate/guanylate cyclase domain-containing protein [Accumulibacter sp.]|uniref:CHASE2 domain-containing protein n=1 Tax=Accumulibacter sp. TaxID=2053492 RepID=UPI0034373D4B|nr:adenylate/guanylate cyclase domain-containing protein [Accumulibacter sp.]MCM8634579.1 adenylate/guanylate cyclase domain-containing protein [Accumulibacter sp.]MCM8638135.1 adenylate/guanylate cyclase domain-containing protein [Accumulibacter sp.]
MRFIELAVLNRLDAALYDARVRWFAQAPIDERIVIVDIDERSLAELGRWPWNRARLAELVERIFTDHGALLLGLDLILAEADESSGLPVLESLARGPLRQNAAFRATVEGLRPTLDYDGRLADVLRRHPVVLGFHLSTGAAAARSGALPPALPIDAGERVQATGLTDWPGYGANLPLLQQVAAGGGFLGAPVDPDGVVRRGWLLARHADQIHGALPLIMARLLLGDPALRLRFADPLPGQATGPPLTAIELHGTRGLRLIAVDPQGAVLLPFRRAAGGFHYHSAADVAAGRLPGDALRGRIVLLGSSAPGLLDQRVTPVNELLPGVEVHANLLAGLLAGSLPHVPAWTMPLEVAVLSFLALLLLRLLPRLSPQAAVGLTMMLVLVLAVLILLAWGTAGLVLPAATSLCLLLLLLVLQLFFGSFVESRARRRLAALFGQYVPPELVDEMSRDPERYDMRGRSAELTVLFADIRGFTTIAEQMPANELATMMNDYLSAMTDVIRAHRGTLDKYVGDAIVAFWGAPVADPLHARHAVAAALAMQAALPALNRLLAVRGWPQLHIGIGINSGVMVVGDMGSRHRRAYTVLGDAVNLAARLQGLSAHYEAGVIVGEATRQQLGDWPCRELDRVAVRGRAARVTIHEPLAD